MLFGLPFLQSVWYTTKYTLIKTSYLGPPILPPSSPIDAAVSLGAALEGKHIPYAIGGALAYNLYGVPRATHDLDVNVFIVAVQEDYLVYLVEGMTQIFD